MPDEQALDEAIAEFEGELFELLRTSRRRDDPEVVRLWGRIKDDVGDVRMLLGRATPRGRAVAELNQLLAHRPKTRAQWKLEAARELTHSLRALAPLFGDRAYLRTALESDKIRGRFAKAFGDDALAEADGALATSSGDDEAAALVAEQLRRLALGRANGRRKEWTRHELRSRALLWMLLSLVPLVVATGVLLAAADATAPWEVAVAAVTGALGSVLGGFYKLRDEAKTLTALRTFRSALFLQPVVGAAAGLVAFALVRVGILHMPPADHAPSVATFAVYGFVLGFSEPVFVGLVRRLPQQRDGEDR